MVWHGSENAKAEWNEYRKKKEKGGTKAYAECSPYDSTDQEVPAGEDRG